MCVCVGGGVLLPEMWTKYAMNSNFMMSLTHEGADSTTRLCFNFFFEFWDFGNWHGDLRAQCILHTIFDLCTLKYMYLRTHNLQSCNVEFPHHPAFCTASMYLENVNHAVLQEGGGIRPNPLNLPRA